MRYTVVTIENGKVLKKTIESAYILLQDFPHLNDADNDKGIYYCPLPDVPVKRIKTIANATAKELVVGAPVQFHNDCHPDLDEMGKITAIKLGEHDEVLVSVKWSPSGAVDSDCSLDYYDSTWLVESA